MAALDFFFIESKNLKLFFFNAKTGSMNVSLLVNLLKNEFLTFFGIHSNFSTQCFTSVSHFLPFLNTYFSKMTLLVLKMLQDNIKTLSGFNTIRFESFNAKPFHSTPYSI